MKSRFDNIRTYIYTICMLIMIFDAKTTIDAGKEGILLCTYTVIPSLFPFIFISILINKYASSIRFRVLQPTGKLLKIPKGSENVLIPGFIGGYPLGAQAVTTAWIRGDLSTPTAHRMLAFCSNAGPAFIFGMSAGIFPSITYSWLLWMIHILSAAITSYLFPNPKEKNQKEQNTPIPINEPLILTAVKSMANICGWVIISRIFLTYIENYLLKYASSTPTILLSGCIELSNGIIGLQEISNLGFRFILFSGFIGFGGICVLLQTATVTEPLGLGYYLQGKVIQCLISVVIASALQCYIFQNPYRISYPIVTYMCIFLCIFMLRSYALKKKIVAFSEELMYNDRKATE